MSEGCGRLLRGSGRRRVCEAFKRPRSGVRGSVRKRAVLVFVVIPTSRPLSLRPPQAPAMRGAASAGPHERDWEEKAAGRKKRVLSILEPV